MSHALSNRHNTFDFLRFMAALAVIFAHSYALAGKLRWPVTVESGNRITFFAVATFFVISGYLITHSWQKLPQPIAFLKKRFLRLWPGLVVASFFTILVVGPLVTTLPVQRYFTNLKTWLYPVNAATLYHIQYQLPGVFENSPADSSVNGSLWTLPLEFTCYLAVIAGGSLGLFKHRWLLVTGSVVTALVAASIPLLQLPSSVSHFLLYLLRFAAYFGMGIAFAFTPRTFFTKHWLGALSFMTFIVFCITPRYHYLALFSFSYLVMYLGFTLPMALNGVRKYGDLSYGMYIYAFPLQQAIVYFTQHRLHPLQVFGLSLVLILPLSLVSWKFVEAPALRFKPGSK